MTYIPSKKVHESLKAAREQRRFSLPMIHQETRISIPYLEALEQGNWNAFPAEVYLLGFLRKYSLYLGLDPDEMVNLYKSELTDAQTRKSKEDKEIQSQRHHEKSSTAYKLFLLFLILALFAGGGLFSLFRRPREMERPAAIPMEHLKKKLPESTLLQNENLALNVEALDTVWLRILGDQKLLYEGFVPRGSSRTWEAQNEIFVRMGNANATKMNLNGRPLDPGAGAKQGVNEIHLTRSALEFSPSSGEGMPVAAEPPRPARRFVPRQAVLKSSPTLQP